MKLSTKAAIYSGLIFPGAGFFLVNRRQLGFVITVINVAAVLAIITFASQIAHGIADQIASGRLLPYPTVVIDEVRKSLASADSSIYNFSKSVIIMSWLISIPLSWWFGKAIEDTAETNTTPTPQ